MTKRKIHAVNVTVYVEQEGRPALPTRSEIADGLIRGLPGQLVSVDYGADQEGVKLNQEVRVLGVYSNVASDPVDRIKPDLADLRNS